MHPILSNPAFTCISCQIAFIVISFLRSVVPALRDFFCFFLFCPFSLDIQSSMSWQDLWVPFLRHPIPASSQILTCIQRPQLLLTLLQWMSPTSFSCFCCSCFDWLIACSNALFNCIFNTSFLFRLTGQVFGNLHTYTAFLFRLIVLVSCSNTYLTQLSCFNWFFKCLVLLQTYTVFLSWLTVRVSCSIAYSTQLSCLYCFLFGNLRIVLLSTNSFVVWSCEKASSPNPCELPEFCLVHCGNCICRGSGTRRNQSVRTHGGTSGSPSVFAHSDSDNLTGFKHLLSLFPRNITTLADENLLGYVSFSTLHIETTVARGLAWFSCRELVSVEEFGWNCCGFAHCNKQQSHRSIFWLKHLLFRYKETQPL